MGWVRSTCGSCKIIVGARDGKTIYATVLQWVTPKCDVMEWIGIIWLMVGSVSLYGSCEYGDEPSGSINLRYFLTSVAGDCTELRPAGRAPKHRCSINIQNNGAITTAKGAATSVLCVGVCKYL